MGLADEYRGQFEWRDWQRVFAALPPLSGKLVLDLGCGPGDLAAELAARGARVLGVDADEELLRAARERRIAGAEFHAADLRALPAFASQADGIWCSFAAAYFVDLGPVLAGWKRALAPGGWIALVEIDDLFAHEPIAASTRELLADYVDEALAARRYDFRMGQRLEAHLATAGFRVVRRLELPDRELAFDGPAPPEVIAAWRARFDRMALLRERCGSTFEGVKEDFLTGLARADHTSRARVVTCIACT